MLSAAAGLLAVQGGAALGWVGSRWGLPVRRFRTVLAEPLVGLHLLSVVLGALPLGMAPLTVLLCVRGWTGSSALAGTAAGALALGNGAGLVLQGGLVDTHGPRRVVGAAGVVCVAALTALLLAGTSGASAALLLALAAVAGTSIPVTTAAVRAWLPTVLGTPDERTTAYALVSVAFQVALATGPLLVGGCLLLGGPSAAAAGTAAVVLVGSLFHVAVARPLSRGRTGRGSAENPLTPGVLVLLGVAALSGCSSGVLLVVLPGVATRAGTPAASSLLFTALAIGEGAGALALGAARSAAPRRTQLVCALGALTTAGAVAAAATGSVATLLVAVVLVGAAAAPVAVLLSALVDDVARVGTTARAYSLLVGVGLLGVAAGSAGSGQVVDHTAPGRLLLGAAIATSLACAVAVAGRRRLAPTPGADD